MDGLAPARQVANPQQAHSQIASMAMAAMQLLREDWGTKVSGSRRRSTMADEVDALGPVGYLVAEFPGNKMTGEGFPLLVDLVDRGIVRILDLLFVTKETDGSLT